MKVIAVITAAIVGLPFIIAIILLDSLLLCKMWEWFMTPLFGMRAISIPAAIGLSCICAYLTHQTVQKPNADAPWFERYQQLVRDPIVFAVAYVAHLFM